MKDDINPMHNIGYGRGDDAPPARRQTMAYSFVEPRDKVKPTVIDNGLTDMNRIMFELVEKDFNAWMSLPESVRKLMITCPADFTLIHTEECSVPNIIHCGIEFAFDGGVWVLKDIK